MYDHFHEYTQEDLLFDYFFFNMFGGLHESEHDQAGPHDFTTSLSMLSHFLGGAGPQTLGV